MDITVGVLLISSALLALILLLWVQLWVNKYKLYKDVEKHGNTTVNDNIDSSTNLALTWTYGALLFSLIAFACIALGVWGGETWKKLGISSLGVSFSMLVIEVLISVFSSGCKFWNNKNVDESCHLNMDERLSKILLIGMPTFFSIFSLCAIFSRTYWLMFGNFVVSVVAAIIIWRVIHRRNAQSTNTT